MGTSVEAIMRDNKRLREERDLAREQVAFLLSALMGDDTLPLEWNLTESEERIMRVILTREYASKDAIMAALYWDKDEPGEEKIVDVLICKIRKKIKPYGIDINADSDEAGRLFRGEVGHLFRFHSGQCSDLKPDTLLV